MNPATASNVPQNVLCSSFYLLHNTKDLLRVPGLPIRDFARGCNNRGHTRPQLSEIDVTEKTFFERLYLVLVLRKFAPLVNCPYAPTAPTIQSTTISRFLCPGWALIFFGQIH